MVFKPGQSGNPGGRPKAEAEVVALARKASPDALRRLIELVKSPDPRAAIAAANAILDRALGKPTQAVQMGGVDGKPIAAKITVEFVKSKPGES